MKNSILNNFKRNPFEEVEKGILNPSKLNNEKYSIFSKSQIFSYLKNVLEKNEGMALEIQKSVVANVKSEFTNLIPIKIKHNGNVKDFYVAKTGVCKELEKAVDPVNKQEGYFDNNVDEEEVLEFIKNYSNVDDDMLIKKFGKDVVDVLNSLEEEGKINTDDEGHYLVVEESEEENEEEENNEEKNEGEENEEEDKEIENKEGNEGEEENDEEFEENEEIKEEGDEEKEDIDIEEEGDEENIEENEEGEEDEDGEDTNNEEVNEEDDKSVKNEEDEDSVLEEDQDENFEKDDEEDDNDNIENDIENDEEVNNEDEDKVDDEEDFEEDDVNDENEEGEEDNEDNDLNNEDNKEGFENNNLGEESDESDKNKMTPEELEAFAKKTATATLLKFYNNSADEKLKEIAAIELESRGIKVDKDLNKNSKGEDLPDNKDALDALENFTKDYLGKYDMEDLISVVVELANQDPGKRKELKDLYRNYYSMNNNGNKLLKVDENEFKEFLTDHYFNNFTPGDLQSYAYLLISKNPTEYRKYKKMMDLNNKPII